MAVAFAASSIVSAPAQSIGAIKEISGYKPGVTVNELNVTPVRQISSTSVGTRTTSLIPAQTVSPFTLVGLTWVGGVSTGTEFEVRVRESGTWSDWFHLEYGEYQGVGKDGSESVDTRVGSDPLLTGLADGVEVKMENTSGIVPSQMKVTLVNSEVTNQDKFIGKQSMRMATNDPLSQAQSGVVTSLEAVSPQGAVVPRPRIVSRAEWGADETWREASAASGNKDRCRLCASHCNYEQLHTQNKLQHKCEIYTPTTLKALKYADMGYNFLVDQISARFMKAATLVLLVKDPCQL